MGFQPRHEVQREHLRAESSIGALNTSVALILDKKLIGRSRLHANIDFMVIIGHEQLASPAIALVHRQIRVSRMAVTITAKCG